MMTFNLDLCPYSSKSHEQKFRTPRQEQTEHLPNELFSKTIQNQCEKGEAYCWSICQELPEECNKIEDAVCIDGHMLRCK